MNKLGFAIKLASNGVSMPIVCNKDQWTNKVVDIRDFLKLFNGLAYIEQGHQVSTGNSTTFISFDEEGCFLVLFKALSGRIGDFLSGWIYIPNTIEATGDDIINAYDYVRNILSQSNLNDSIEKIKEFFSKEYPKQEYAAQYVPSSGDEFGVRFLDVYYSMKEILDADRYQPYYSNFKAIFLLDKSGEVKIAKEQVARFKDLTKITIEKTCIFKAPSPEEVSLLGRGTKIVFSTKQEFNSPVLTKKGDRIQLFALRDGFEPVVLPPITIQEDGQKCFIDPRTVKWKKRINPSMFTVYNRNHEKIENVRISINGTDITMGQEVFLYEEDCRQATVKYSAPDYEPFEHKRNLLLNEFCEITLNRKVKSYQTTIELANGKHAEMTLESKYLSSKYDSPLKGYEFEEEYHGGKVLRMSSWFVWKQRLWGFFAALAVVMLIIAYAAFDAWLDTHHFKFGLPPWEENRPAQQYTSGGSIETDDNIQNQTGNQVESEQDDTADFTLDAAIKYLDTNYTWSKTGLGKYPDLQGLYEDMNAFKLSRLVNDWQSKLGTSKIFQKICESANKNLSHSWNPKQGEHNPTYNKPDDEMISLTNYINWLDQDQTPKSSGERGFHPDAKSKGGTNEKKPDSSTGKPKNSQVKSGNGTGETTQNGGL